MQLAIMMRLPLLFARMVVLMVVALLVTMSNASAGNQREEVLADAIKLALARSITDPRPPHLNFANDAERIEWQHWSESVSKRLHSRMPDTMVRSEFLQTLWYEARRAGLEPALILGLIQVESGFRKYAISSVGARGYMQVMPFWTRVIGDGQPSRLFHPPRFVHGARQSWYPAISSHCWCTPAPMIHLQTAGEQNARARASRPRAAASWP